MHSSCTLGRRSISPLPPGVPVHGRGTIRQRGARGCSRQWPAPWVIVGCRGAGPPGTRVGLCFASWRPGAEEAVMSEESTVRSGSAGQPKGLLQQTEELTAALHADLSAPDADL